jgi:glutathione-regulated potassium-efflux system ancillary protein KefC
MIVANFPNATIVARARNVQHYYELYELGVRLIERETLDSALMSGREALEALGWEPHHSSIEAIRDVLSGIAEAAGEPTPPLESARR